MDTLAKIGVATLIAAFFAALITGCSVVPKPTVVETPFCTLSPITLTQDEVDLLSDESMRQIIVINESIEKVCS